MKRNIVVVALLSLMLFSVALAGAWGPDGWQPPDGRNIEEDDFFHVPEIPIGTILSIFVCLTALATFAASKKIRKK